jgi:exodeoxyribonuclease VII small subunit
MKTFEEKMQYLEQLVQELEENKITLAQLSSKINEAKQIIVECSDLLRKTEENTNFDSES